MATGKFVALYRVSTKRQGASGLGLAAQKEAVASYLNGGNWKLVAQFTEVQSGKSTDRPQLDAALAACRLHGATLIVSRLDRLSRSASLLFALRDAGVPFVVASMPTLTPETLPLIIAIADMEREAISQRTRAGLAQAKRRGTKLGNPNHLTDKARRKGSKAAAQQRAADADQRAADVVAFLKPMRDLGASLGDMVRELQAHEIPTPRGGEWTRAAVSRAFLRATKG